MLKPGDYGTMTAVRPGVLRYRKESSWTNGLTRDCLLGYRRRGVRGKKVVEATGSDLGQAPPRGMSMLRSRGCDAMKGAGRNSARWSDESKGGNDLGRLDWHQRPWADEASRNAFEGSMMVLLRARQVDCRRIPTSLDQTLIAKDDAMDTSDLEPSRLRYNGQAPSRCSAAEPKSQPSRLLAGFSAARVVGRLKMRQANFSKVFLDLNFNATRLGELKRPLE